MPRKIDLKSLKTHSSRCLTRTKKRIDDAISAGTHYLLIRWMCQMSAVEAHTIWERYVEKRLVAALNHDPRHFIREEEIKGVKHVSSGLADYIIRGGRRFFDFRFTSELIDRSDSFLGKSANPFRKIDSGDRLYIDALASIRNCIVHNSDAAQTAYRRRLKEVYGITSAPAPDEFLYAKDLRPGSILRYQPRLKGLLTVLSRVIQQT